MATTISSSVTYGITLSSASQSPVIVTSSGEIDTSSNTYANAIGVYAGSTLANISVTNSGAILAFKTNGDFALGIYLKGAAASVTNNAGALIYGESMGVWLPGNSPTLNNQGTIVGANVYGASIYGGGTLVNGSATNTAALINSGGMSGANAGDATVINYGTIAGRTRALNLDRSSVAYNHGTILGNVLFGFANDRLFIYPGSTITGHTYTYEASPTLYLQRASSGTTFGVLTGLNNGHYDGFSSVNVGAGAHWQLNGVNIITPQTTITNNSRYGAGVLRVGHGSTYGVLEGSGIVIGSIQDNGEIASSGGTLDITGNVTGTGELFIALNSELLLEGKVTFGSGGSGNHEITFEQTNGGTETLGLVRTGVFATPIANFGAGDQFDVAKAAFDVYFQASTNLLTINQGPRTFTQLHVLGSFTTANFGITPDGHGGSDIFYKTG